MRPYVHKKATVLFPHVKNSLQKDVFPLLGIGYGGKLALVPLRKQTVIPKEAQLLQEVFWEDASEELLH